MENRSEPSIEHALGFLSNAKTDNERLAALLLVTKIVNPKDLDTEERHQLFSAIGFKFLTRLLKTANVPAECSRNAFQAIALSVLSCFCTDDDLVVHPAMVGCLEDINEIIVSASGDSADDEQLKMVKDCFSILTSMAAHPSGRVALCEHGSVNALCLYFRTGSPPWSSMALEIVRLLVREECDCVWRTSTESVTRLLEQLSITLKEEKDEMAFTACGIILDVLRSSPRGNFNLAKNFWSNVCVGLFDLLRCRIGEVNHNSALMLASQVVGIYGMETIWKNVDNGRQLLPLLVHLSCIEVRMILEDQKAEQIASEKADLLASCFSILESAVVFLYAHLVSEAEQKLAVQFHSGVSGAFSSVVAYLSTLMAPEKQQYILSSTSFACLRLLGAYAGEEDYVQRMEFASILTLIFDICISTFTVRRFCCSTCRSKFANVMFSKAVCESSEHLFKNAPENDNRSGVSSTSESQKQFVSNFIRLDQYILSVLLSDDASTPDKPSSEKTVRFLCPMDEGISAMQAEMISNVSDTTNTSVTEYVDCEPKSSRTVIAVQSSGKKWAWNEKLFDDKGKHVCVCGQVVLSTNLVTVKIDCSPSGSCKEVPDMVRFLLPGLPLLCDFDQTRNTVYESKFQYLVVQYFCDWWCHLVGKDCNSEAVLVIKDLCEALLNLAAYPDLPTCDPAFIYLLEFLFDHMHEFVTKLQSDDTLFKVFGHLIALGLKLSTKFTLKPGSRVENGLKDFVEFACQFLSFVFVVDTVGERQCLKMERSLAEFQDLTYILFLTALESITELTKRYQFMAEIVLMKTWIVKLVQQLLEARGNGLEERGMLLVEMENLLCSLAASSSEARNTCIGIGCISLASLYEMEVLGAILKSGLPTKLRLQ